MPFYTHSHLEQLLVRGKIDVSLLTMPIGDQSIEAIPAIKEEIFLALPPQHPLAGQDEVDLAELADEPFILLKEGQGFRTISLRLCEQAGFRPRIVFESSNIQSALGLGVALLASSLLILVILNLIQRWNSKYES